MGKGGIVMITLNLQVAFPFLTEPNHTGEHYSLSSDRFHSRLWSHTFYLSNGMGLDRVEQTSIDQRDIHW